MRIIVLILMLLVPGALSAQNTQTQKPLPAADSVVLQPFLPTEVTQAFSHTNDLVKEGGKYQVEDEAIVRYRQEVDSLFSIISSFLGDSTKYDMIGMNIREMDQLRSRARSYTTKLEDLQERLARKAEELEASGKELADNEKRWVLTVESNQDEMLDTRLERIGVVIHQLDSVQALLQEDLGTILVELDRIEDREIQLENAIQQISDEKARISERLFHKDMPGFLQDLEHLQDSLLFQPHVEKFVGRLKTDTAIIKEDFSRPLLFYAVLFMVMLVLTFWYRANYLKLLPEGFELTDLHKVFISSPLATTLYAVTLLIRFLLPDLPRTYFSLNVLIMLIPISILLTRIYGRQLRSWIGILAFIFILGMVFELSYYPDILLRILLLVITAGGLYIFTWTFLYKPLRGSMKQGFIYYMFRLLVTIFMIVLAVAVLANLAGSFSAAEFFTLLPIQITMLAVAILVAIRMSDAIIYLILSTKVLLRINAVREDYKAIHRWLLGAADLFFWTFFVISTLRYFRIRDAVFEWGSKVLTEGIPVGQVEITLGNVLIFIFVLWLSILVTRIITRLLDKDVFPRVKVKKGIPNTVILLSKLTLIVAGFFLAAAAAGMKLTNLSIILGAFSVGIGFGLQNIFNNMVSGIILALERPIKVGDVVQVGALVGIVRSIGLRSSTVKSYDGSEVIVPNGNLISKEMINWTLSDNSRRMDIRIRATYGTDPDQVLQIMREVALGHKEVNSKPNPLFLFDDFGESALEFRLLAWVNIDNRLTVESELKLELNRRLKDAGIEIPLPQQDIHIRTESADTTGDQSTGRAKKDV